MYKGIELNTLYECIYNGIDKLEKKYSANFIFGAIIGSYSLGLNSEISDIDCLWLCSKPWQETQPAIRINNAPKIDIMVRDLTTVTKEIAERNRLELNFPLAFNGKDIYLEKNATDTNRSDFTASMLHRILSSPYVMDKSNKIEQYRRHIHKNLYKIDVLDYYFTRAYGNYVNYLQGDDVSVRKYLYTLHGIYSMKYIISYNKLPKQNFMSLNRSFGEGSMMKKIDLLLEINKKIIDKSINTVECDKELTQYICHQIQLLAEQIKRVDKQQRIYFA